MLTPTLLPSTSAPQEGPSRAVVLQDDKAIMHLIELLVSRAGISQREIAKRIGIKPQSLNQYMIFRRRRPSVQWLARLAGVCGGRLVLEFPEEGLQGNSHG